MRHSHRIKQEQHGSKDVVFIRHGHSKGQAAEKHQRKVDKGLIDADLSDKGYAQAKVLAEKIKQLPEELAEKVPPIPKYGTLDLALIKESMYFFA